MNLEIVLWAGGMLFTLSIFALKVGFGLGYGRVGTRGIIFALTSYVALFVLIAQLSERLIQLLEPLLRKGPYPHTLIAAGMIAWGIFTLKGSYDMNHDEHKPVKSLFKPSLLLITPCPVCVTAMTFSTWAALSVIKLPAALVGLGMGITFAALSLLLLTFTRNRNTESPETPLGLAMIAIGFYFIASLSLPAKIEEAKGVYLSFPDKGDVVDPNNTAGVLIVLIMALLIGFFSNRRKEIKE
jgi:predicted transporter